MAYSIYETHTADNVAASSDGVAVSGTSVYYSEVMKVSQHGLLGFQLDWTGTPTGTFELFWSDHDNPDRASDTGWKKDSTILMTQPAGAAGSEVYSIDGAEMTWARVKYTNASGTGVVKGSQGHGRV